MKLSIFILMILFTMVPGSDPDTKAELDENSIDHIKAVFATIKESDQRYRTSLSNGTTDPVINAQIKATCDAGTAEECIKYTQSLNLKLEDSVRDSLVELQSTLDFQNHMTVRGIWERYGWIGEDVVEEYNYVQILLLLHPPYSLDYVPAYLEEYSTLLMKEVQAGRMPAKTYASFYDNIHAKILREPQLYGTNFKFDRETQKVLPPGIRDIVVTNAARLEIGMEPLAEGEYRIEG